MQRRLMQIFTFILEWGQGTCLLTKHTLRWAYSRYFSPACCLLRFAAFLNTCSIFAQHTHKKTHRYRHTVFHIDSV